MQKITIRPSTLPTSTTYIAEQVKTTAPFQNPYTSGGCSGLTGCADYSAVVKCLVEIYQGIRSCQTIYLVDKDGSLLDTDRLEYIDITLTNEYGCSVYWFSTRGLEDYNPIEILQTKINGEVLHLTPDNLLEQRDVFFDMKNIGIVENMIRFGGDGTLGEMTTVPLEYNDELVIKTSSRENKVLNLVVKVNGSPNPVRVGEDTKLITLSTGSEAIFDILGCDSNGNVEEVNLDELTIETPALVKDKGAIRICFESYETSHLIPSALNAVITMKFKDDDLAEGGSTHVISCVPIGSVKKNINLSDENETPLISYEIKPERITYDNKKSGLQSTLMLDAVCELNTEIENASPDKYYEETFVCEEIPGKDYHTVVYDELNNIYYWDVFHMLGTEGVNVTTEDLNGNDIYGDIVYITKNHLRVYFVDCVGGKIYIN